MSEFINSAPVALINGTNNDVNRSNSICYDMNTHDYNNLPSRVLIDNFVSKCNTIFRALDSLNNNDYELKTKTSLCDKSDVLCSQEEKSQILKTIKSEKSETVRIRQSMTFFANQTARKVAVKRLFARDIVSSSTSSSTVSKSHMFQQLRLVQK